MTDEEKNNYCDVGSSKIMKKSNIKILMRQNKDIGLLKKIISSLIKDTVSSLRVGIDGQKPDDGIFNNYFERLMQLINLRLKICDYEFTNLERLSVLINNSNYSRENNMEYKDVEILENYVKKHCMLN